MKPPSKLRPIDQNLSKSQTATFTNTASALLQIENAYQKEMMNEIEDDLTDYLDANKIMAQMSTAFGDSVDKPKKDEQTKTKLRKENKSSLDPILEETPGALVLFTNNMTLQEQRAKKNEILK